MKERLKNWWDGKFIPYDNSPNDGVFMIGGFQHRHWTSEIAHKIWGFLKVEWKWVVGFLLTSIGLLMTYIRFF